jgi:hypothetical protein
MILLHDDLIFSSGGNRLCFVSPQNKKRCLKLLRPDRTPKIRRNEKSFPANLRPLSFFDENRSEQARLKFLFNRFPPEITSHLPHSYGIVQTSRGLAHETDLIRDKNGSISQSLEQYIWDNGLNETAKSAIDTFFQDWTKAPPKTRDLIPHNMVISFNSESAQIILIDGLGRMPLIPSFKGTRMSLRRLLKRRENFDERIQRILLRISRKEAPNARITSIDRSL